MASSGAFLFVSFIILASCILPAVEWRLHSVAEVSTSEPFEKPKRRPRGSINQSPDGSEWSAQKPRGQRRSQSASTPRRTTPSVSSALRSTSTTLLKYMFYSGTASRQRAISLQYPRQILPRRLCAADDHVCPRPIPRFDTRCRSFVCKL